MNHLSRITLFSPCKRASSFVAKTLSCEYSTLSWKINSSFVGVKVITLDSLLTRFRAQCYSTRARKGSSSSSTSTSKSRKMDPKKGLDKEKDAFFVVRKGDIIGVYKSFSDCQAQVGSSICDPPVSVYKGYSLSRDTEEHLKSCGLKNALYTLRASDVKEDIFGTLTPCSIQEPDSSKGELTGNDGSKKRSVEALGSEIVTADTSSKHVKLDVQSVAKAHSSDSRSCILEFDGAAKGNPGKAGAGAVLRTIDGSLICRLREGVGTATNNVAEYRAVILGLRSALEKGYTGIRVLGDSKLVCMQLQGKWKVKHQSMCVMYEIAKKLKDKFLSFDISHVLRDLNAEADAQANLAINLADGQVQEDLVS